MKNCTLIIFSLFFLNTVKAQHTLSGHVTDKSDKKKLVEGVAVFVPEFQKSDVSKEGGTYIIRGIGSGIVTVQFTKVGYRSLVKTVNTKDSATVLEVEMEPSTIELEEVTITSNSSSLPDDIPYPVNTVPNEELSRSGNVNLMTSLASEPGIDKITVGNGITKPVIRGLSFSRILLYQNGTRIENQPWDDRHDLGINENGVDKVEIIKGPAALIYGADALGGALIFVDEKPPVDGNKKGSINFGFFSNTLGVNLDAGVKGASDKGIFWSVRAGGQSHTSYVQGEGLAVKKNTEAKDFAANSKFQTINGKAMIGMRKKWGVSKLTYSFRNQLTGIVEQETNTTQTIADQNAEQRDREMEAPYQDVTSHIITSENTFISGTSKWNVNAGYQLNDRKEFEPLPLKQKELAIGLRLNTMTYDVKWTSDPEKKIGFTLGTQGMFQKNENTGKELLVPNADVSDIAAYGLLRYDIGKWNFLAGGRFDLRNIEANTNEGGVVDTADHRPELDLKKEYHPVNGSLGIVFRPDEQLTLKGNFASGYTAPNYAELGTYGKHEGTYRFEIGNPELQLEQNYEGDLGVIWETKSVAFGISGYYNYLNNYIYIGIRGDSLNGLPVYNARQSDANIKGAETSLDIHPAKIKWLDFKTSFAMTKGELKKGGNLPWIPAKKLITELKFTGAKLDYIQNPFISLVMSNYLEQTDVAEYELATASYTLFDVHIGGSFTWGNQLMDVTLSGMNLLNEGYFNHLSLIKSIGIKEMGRNIVLQLKIPFGFKAKAKPEVKP
ncbi:MAG: TonB-dependent receptor [Bacteroidetes bacterium]|nr:TonB-dependent receptor [Bacteroidota bacterium]